ncbi:hypothetical protein JHK85_025550 [Glycine max]|nr:hypothetical protein JHK85_025550 [Glycine max]
MRQLGEGGFAYVYLVKEAPNDSATAGLAKKLKGSSHLSVLNASSRGLHRYAGE